jgi:chitinase
MKRLIDVKRFSFPFSLAPWLLLVVSAMVALSGSAAWAHSIPIFHLAHISRTSRKARPLIVGYFPEWGLYYPKPYYVKALVTSGAADRLDQINYAQASVRNGRCSLSDPKADLNATYSADISVNGKADDPRSPFRGYFHQLQELKHRYPRLKILISLEGKASDFAEDAQAENRQAFVASCVNTFLRGHFAPGVSKPGIFDGIDVDWESPQQEDAENFRALLEEFRRQMNGVRRDARLSVAVGANPGDLPGTDFASVAKLVDEVGVMNYDYAGPWNTTTGFVAPLFTNPAAPHDYSSSIERSIDSYKAAGVAATKLLMGLPFYGYGWTDVQKSNNGLFQPGHGVRGDQPYHSIRSLAPPFAVYRDERSQAPWLFDGDTFWTYEDPVSVGFKASYAAHEKLAGVMIWELSGDTEDAELLNAAYRSLHHPLDPSAFAEAATGKPAAAE